jgi:AraC-like DNA-binding protein
MGYDGDRLVWENRRVRSRDVCFGEVLYQPGGSCGPRFQRDYQLVFVHSGDVRVDVDGQTRRLAPGRIGLFLPGHEEHFSFAESRPTHHSWCAVAPKALPSATRQSIESVPNTLACNEVLTRLLAVSLSLGRIESPAGSHVVDQLGFALFAAYAHAGSVATDALAGDPVVLKATRFLEEHMRDRDCFRKAHDAAGVSRNTLISRFRRDLKTTPARYVWRLRTERGIEMLADTGLTIAEIAFACGFQTPFHFSRLVKNLQGISPQQIRSQGWARAQPPTRSSGPIGTPRRER